jgi:flagellar basal-body rod protein FlgB
VVRLTSEHGSLERSAPRIGDPLHRPTIGTVISDLTSRTLQASLHGLDARRRAAEDNVANIETPGFTASTVSFEDSLRAALGRGVPASAEVTVARSAGAPRLNGNNVDIADELTGLTETALRHQLVIQALNGRYAVMRTAIGA